MGTVGSCTNFRNRVVLHICAWGTEGDCMAPLIRHCICILNSNCNKSGDVAGEKVRGNQILNQNTLVSVPAQWNLEKGGLAQASLYYDTELTTHHEIMAPEAISVPGSCCFCGQ